MACTWSIGCGLVPAHGGQIIITYFDGLVQDCGIPIAKAFGILQSSTKPSISQILDSRGNAAMSLSYS